jgi:PKD repeat protein
MWDENNNKITCADFEVFSGDGNPAWRNLPGAGDIVYTDWTDAFIPLQNYIGQVVTIDFSVGDCDLGGHWAYAYVEAHCGGNLTVSNSEICVGETATITAPDGASAYLWNTGETTQSIDVTEAGLFEVQLTGTGGGTCFSTMSHNITLKAMPLADFLADTVCLTNATSFTDKSLQATSGLKSWGWDFDGNGSIDDITQHPNYVFLTAGSHPVKLITDDYNGCVHDTTFNVFVPDLVVPDFTNSSVCFNSVTQFTNTSIGTIDKWEWDFTNDGVIDDINENPSHEYPNHGVFTTKLTVTSDLGCSASINKNVTINPLPVANFTNIDLCFPQSMSFTNTSTVPTGNVISWDWDFGDNSGVSNLENSSYGFSRAGSYDVTLIISSDMGCVDSTEKEVH